MDLDEFAALSTEQVKSFVTDANIVKNIRVEERDSAAYEAITYAGRQGVFKLKLKQYF